jgi:hypothetical protein
MVLRLEHSHRPTLEDHVHRATRRAAVGRSGAETPGTVSAAVGMKWTLNLGPVELYQSAELLTLSRD